MTSRLGCSDGYCSADVVRSSEPVRSVNVVRSAGAAVLRFGGDCSSTGGDYCSGAVVVVGWCCSVEDAVSDSVPGVGSVLDVGSALDVGSVVDVGSGQGEDARR